MSNQTQRIKHSHRLLRERAAIRRQIGIARAHKAPVKNPHGLGKHHAMDCGTPGCMLCGNPRRNPFYKSARRTIQERKLMQDIKHERDKHSNGLYPKKSD